MARNNGGVYSKNFLEAKQAFIDKYKLPIKVKFQSLKFDTNDVPSTNADYGHVVDNRNDSNYKSPTWDFLVKEMQHGEDVELEFGYYDTTGTRKGGHWVTVSGVSDVGTAKGIYFKDDSRQDSAGGLRQQYVNWVDKNGYSYLSQISSSKYTCWVETIVSESYDSTVTFDAQGVLEKQNSIYKLGVYENPSSLDESISITFELSNSYYINIMVYDIHGNKIMQIAEGFYPDGRSIIQWNSKDNSGNRISAGSYFIVLRANGIENVVKIIKE